jgi:2-aminoethylphosphonate-pyruvate transaminase
MAMILLNPGPVVLSQRVRHALNGPDLCHREAEFAELQSTIRQRLLKVYELDASRYAAVLLTGSGTAAMEAMVASLVPESRRLGVIENGVYGERLSRIADIHGITHGAFRLGWGEAVNLDTLERWLDANRDATHLAVVHHETTTGRLNPVGAIGKLCKERGIALLVDGVSSFGGEALDFEDWGIAACAGTANKCLHGVPGTSFVITRRDALPASAARPRTLYLDLGGYCREQDKGGTPFTQSVQTFYALAEALAEFEEEGGWRARHARYAALAAQVREGLKAMGIRPLLPDDASSVVLNAYYLPDGVTYEQLHDHLKDQGFVIYSGQGALARSIFRISTMGAITAADMDRLLDAFRALLSDC